MGTQRSASDRPFGGTTSGARFDVAMKVTRGDTQYLATHATTSRGRGRLVWAVLDCAVARNARSRAGRTRRTVPRRATRSERSSRRLPRATPCLRRSSQVGRHQHTRRIRREQSCCQRTYGCRPHLGASHRSRTRSSTLLNAGQFRRLGASSRARFVRFWRRRLGAAGLLRTVEQQSCRNHLLQDQICWLALGSRVLTGAPGGG